MKIRSNYDMHSCTKSISSFVHADVPRCQIQPSGINDDWFDAVFSGTTSSDYDTNSTIKPAKCQWAKNHACMTMSCINIQHETMQSRQVAECYKCASNITEESSLQPVSNALTYVIDICQVRPCVMRTSQWGHPIASWLLCRFLLSLWSVKN